MTWSMPINAKPAFGMKICQEMSVGENLHSYLSQGRAVLNGAEAGGFKNKLKNVFGHDADYVLIRLDALPRRTVVNIARMFTNTVTNVPHVPSQAPMEELIGIIENICQFHGLDGLKDAKFKDSVIFLTDEKSSMLKSIAANQTKWNEYTIAAGEINEIDDKHSIPVLVDEQIVKDYYRNTETGSLRVPQRGQKRRMMDDTFTTELQKQRDQPLPANDQVEQYILNTQQQISTCRELTEQMISCKPDQRMAVVNELETAYEQMDVSTTDLSEQLEKVKSEAMDAMNTAQHKLQLSQLAEQNTKKELEDYQILIEQQNEFHAETVNALANRLTQTTRKLDIAEEGHKELETALEEEKQTNQNRVENLEHDQKIKIENLTEQIDDHKVDAEQYSKELKEALNKVSDYAKLKQECDQLQRRADSIKIDRAISPIKFPPIKKEETINDHWTMGDGSDSDEDDDEVDPFGTATMTSLKLNDSRPRLNPMTEQSGEPKVDKFVATPAKFGIPIWNPVEFSFLEHMAQCRRGLAYAEEKKCGLKERQNLLLLTLPRDYQFVSEFLETEDKADMQKFQAKMVELIMGTSWDTSSLLINAHRRPNERILSYFLRLTNTYLFCTGKTETQIEDDVWVCMMLYQKILEALPLGAKAEFQRDCESGMNSGQLKFTELKKKIISIARKAPVLQHLRAHTPGIEVINNPEEAYRQKSKGDKAGTAGSSASSISRESTPRQEKRSCFYCKKVGHLKHNCYKRQRDMNGKTNSSKSDKNEKDDKDGRRATQ